MNRRLYLQSILLKFSLRCRPSRFSPKAFLLPILIFALIFSGFPQIWQYSGIPLGIQEVQAAKAPSADLVISSLSNPPASADVGTSFDVTDTTANTGTGAAKGLLKSADALRRHNKQVRDIANKLGLTKDQTQRLHREISRQGMLFQEVLDFAKDLFGK